jgi:hypothetical protein
MCPHHAWQHWHYNRQCRNRHSHHFEGKALVSTKTNDHQEPKNYLPSLNSELSLRSVDESDTDLPAFRAPSITRNTLPNGGIGDAGITLRMGMTPRRARAGIIGTLKVRLWSLLNRRTEVCLPAFHFEHSGRSVDESNANFPVVCAKSITCKTLLKGGIGNFITAPGLGSAWGNGFECNSNWGPRLYREMAIVCSAVFEKVIASQRRKVRTERLE